MLYRSLAKFIIGLEVMTAMTDIQRILIEACSKVRSQVSSLVGTEEANKSYGVGAGGDISRKIDILAERAVMDTLKDHGLSCIVVAEETHG